MPSECPCAPMKLSEVRTISDSKPIDGSWITNGAQTSSQHDRLFGSGPYFCSVGGCDGKADSDLIVARETSEPEESVRKLRRFSRFTATLTGRS